MVLRRYPQTTFRILIIHGLEPDAVFRVAKVVLGRIVELGDQERVAGGDLRDFEYSGKDPEEYILLCMPVEE